MCKLGDASLASRGDLDFTIKIAQNLPKTNIGIHLNLEFNKDVSKILT